ncbi:MAG: hypothetical protein IKA87_03620 [Lentisphaeria bacterium]|nr:hypothetical protein [Lentisphaeria bacterium]
MRRFVKTACLLTVIPAAVLLCGAAAAGTGQRKQTLHFIQDDAQDRMISRIFTLKYLHANDIAPFVTGMVRRYNMNSSVSCFSYVYGNTRQQILSVTTPARMMVCVEDFLQKADRRITVNGKVPDEILCGTGVTRGVYRPRYRSGQILINLIVNALVNAGPYSSLYGYDANSNQIYWKDNGSNTAYVYQFLSYIDRPPPQLKMSFSVFEVRESTLRDVGIEYLAWKNGPGLNLLQFGFQAIDLSSAGSTALQGLSGPLGGFFFAPQFDASFIRVLEQSGNAKICATGEMTVSNSDTQSYELSFNPGLQNIIKSRNDQSSVTGALLSAQANIMQLKIVTPVVCIDNEEPDAFTIPPYYPGINSGRPGILFFGYEIKNSGSVERNNYGTELISSTTFSGNAGIELNREKILGSWELEREVEQTIGIPWLSEIPYLKYLFSTTTVNRERSYFFLTVNAELPDTAKPADLSGKLIKLR